MDTAFARRLIVGVVVCCTGAAALAGPLTPPGAPSSTGKTLTEVEPRIAVNATNTPGDADSIFRITLPGSYYLTGNVTGAAGFHGVEIQTNDVTLDLNGFSLLGVSGSLNGVNMPNFAVNVVIRNGHVRAWGGSGVSARIDIGRIERVTAYGNGGWGIDNAPSGTYTTHIVSCEAMGNGAIVAGAGGIRGGQVSVITDCLAFSNTGAGILAGQGSRVAGCLSRSNIGDGIVVSTGSVVSNCTADSNSGDGIEANADCTIIGNSCDGNGASVADGAGIHVTAFDNRIEGNNVTDNDRGIDVDASGNFITRNTCGGNAVNWDIAFGNVCLIVSATTSGAISGNSGGVAPGSTDPNANFTY
jgi:parallel beta-helix repeat protein